MDVVRAVKLNLAGEGRDLCAVVPLPLVEQGGGEVSPPLGAAAVEPSGGPVFQPDVLLGHCFFIFVFVWWWNVYIFCPERHSAKRTAAKGKGRRGREARGGEFKGRVLFDAAVEGTSSHRGQFLHGHASCVTV